MYRHTGALIIKFFTKHVFLTILRASRCNVIIWCMIRGEEEEEEEGEEVRSLIAPPPPPAAPAAV